MFSLCFNGLFLYAICPFSRWLSSSSSLSSAIPSFPSSFPFARTTFYFVLYLYIELSRFCCTHCAKLECIIKFLCTIVDIHCRCIYHVYIFNYRIIIVILFFSSRCDPMFLSCFYLRSFGCSSFFSNCKCTGRHTYISILMKKLQHFSRCLNVIAARRWLTLIFVSAFTFDSIRFRRGGEGVQNENGWKMHSNRAKHMIKVTWKWIEWTHSIFHIYLPIQKVNVLYFMNKRILM